MRVETTLRMAALKDQLILYRLKLFWIILYVVKYLSYFYIYIN